MRSQRARSPGFAGPLLCARPTAHTHHFVSDGRREDAGDVLSGHHVQHLNHGLQASRSAGQRRVCACGCGPHIRQARHACTQPAATGRDVRHARRARTANRVRLLLHPGALAHKQAKGRGCGHAAQSPCCSAFWGAQCRRCLPRNVRIQAGATVHTDTDPIHARCARPAAAGAGASVQG